ncbi:hypothetical protein [Haloprofundus halobius]|uniref:hypothetical protein n=1 Tax=Haloprofundus halobius TaxID=2876194 RepID=UPI003CCE4D87
MEFREVIETRRSVHEYTDEEIDDEESKAKLQEVAGGQEHVGDAAASVVVLGSKDPEAHADRVLDDWVEKGDLPNEDVRDAVRANVDGMAEMPEPERRVWTTRSTSLVGMS